MAGGLVWYGATISGQQSGVFTGRDLKTGEIKRQFPPDLETYWFHHRCHRGKATENYMLTSRTGIEFIDIEKGHWTPHHWVRGACLYGILPANGLIYAPPHPCACYLESKTYGFNALAPASNGPRVPESAAQAPRLEKGDDVRAAPQRRFISCAVRGCDARVRYTTPWSIMASATLTNPAILAPTT